MHQGIGLGHSAAAALLAGGIVQQDLCADAKRIAREDPPTVERPPA